MLSSLITFENPLHAVPVIKLSIDPERQIMQRLKSLLFCTIRKLVENDLQFIVLAAYDEYGVGIPFFGSKDGDAIQSVAEEFRWHHS